MSVPAVTFEPASFADLPGWHADDHSAALAAFQKSCANVIAGRSCPEACLEAEGVPRHSAKAFFEQYFKPHRVVHDAAPGFLTGYYEPLIEGSRTATSEFAIPVYERPADLVNLVDESERGSQRVGLTHARKVTTGNVPFFTRQEIEAGALAGQGLELVYLADPVDVFFMQIQGSGRIKLPDGGKIRITYDGKNGHPYTSVGRYLIDAGEVAADQMSLDTLGEWLRRDPVRGRAVMHRNQSYVFFRELGGREAASAQGVHGIPLTPGRSLAVDTSVHRIGLPIYVVSPHSTHAAAGQPFQRLMIAQDVGSAITGPERGDIYFGSGRDAGQLAGITKHPGTFFVLLPNSAVRSIAPVGQSRP